MVYHLNPQIDEIYGKAKSTGLLNEFRLNYLKYKPEFMTNLLWSMIRWEVDSKNKLPLNDNEKYDITLFFVYLLVEYDKPQFGQPVDVHGIDKQLQSKLDALSLEVQDNYLDTDLVGYRGNIEKVYISAAMYRLIISSIFRGPISLFHYGSWGWPHQFFIYKDAQMMNMVEMEIYNISNGEITTKDILKMRLEVEYPNFYGLNILPTIRFMNWSVNPLD